VKPLLIAEAKGIEIYSFTGAVNSFFSSPYAPHLKCAAVDISTSFDFGAEALSPVTGIVDKIIEVDSGIGKYSKKDYIISIKPKKRSKTRIKIMHAEPLVKPGDKIHVGDVIGKYIRTNYFSYHHIPHIHVEVCSNESLAPSRAIQLKIAKPMPPYYPVENLLKLKVEVVKRDFILCSLSSAKNIIIASSKNPIAVNTIIIEGPLPYVGLIGEISDRKILFLDCSLKVLRTFSTASIAAPLNISYMKWFYLKQMSIISGLAKEKYKLKWLKAYSKEIPIKGIEIFYNTRYLVKLIPEYPLNYSNIPNQIEVFFKKLN